MTDDLKRLIAESLSAEPAPTEDDVKKMIKEHLNSGGRTDQEEDT